MVTVYLFVVNRVILLSGHISSGKTTLSEGISKYYNAEVFKTSEFLKSRFTEGKQLDRKILQDMGDELDEKTKGKWVLDGLNNWLEQQKGLEVIVVDSVRKKGQIEYINDAFWPHVTHIHLTAPENDLESRFKLRQQSELEKEIEYSKAKQNETEKQIDDLANIADFVIDTKRSTAKDVLARAISYVDIPTGKGKGYVDVIIGGQYGSEGKGQIAAYLANEYDILIRVGGPNAGHSVFEKSSKYIYHNLPSGSTMNRKAKLMIGPGAVLDTDVLLKEIHEKKIEGGRLCIDGRAMVIVEQDKSNEKFLVKKIGSTGQGVGSATARRITDRGKEVKLAKDIPDLEKYIGNTVDILEKAYKEGKKILLEGTQGTGLSLYHGEYPFVTSRDTTVSACLSEAGISPKRVRRVIMVCRTYPIRVENPKDGTSGPLKDLTWEEIANRSGYSVNEIKKAEITSTTNRQRRVGEFEWENVHKAAVLNGATDIALTFTDYIDKKNVDARRFEQLTEETFKFIEEVEQVTGAPVSLLSTGFNEHSVIDRRLW